jgi:hypothetical protein
MTDDPPGSDLFIMKTTVAALSAGIGGLPSPYTSG